MNTVALLVCVAAEAILNDKFFDKLKIDTSLLEGISSAVLKWLPRSKLNERQLQVLRSKHGGKVGIVAKDKLYALRDLGVIDSADIVAWTKLRNPSAHGGLVVKDKKYQELLNRIFKVNALIYKLVFLRIGYTGDYTDVGTIGWPFKFFDAAAFLRSINCEGSTRFEAPSQRPRRCTQRRATASSRRRVGGRARAGGDSKPRSP